MLYRLSDLLTEYSEKNTESLYEPAAVGRRGIRKRSEIYSKDLSNDYSKNKIIRYGSFVIGMGTKQIDSGVLCLNEVYSVSPAYHTFKLDLSKVFPDYFQYFFNYKTDSYSQKYMMSGARQGKSVDIKGLLTECIDLPSLNEQKEIVESIEKYNILLSKIEIANSDLDELKYSKFIELFGKPGVENNKWEFVKINDIGTCVAGATPSTKINAYWENGTISWLSSGEVNKYRIYETDSKITQLGYDKTSTKMVPIHSVLVAMAGQGKTRGMAAINEIPLCTNQSICSIVVNERINAMFLLYYLKMQYIELRARSNGEGGRGGLNLKIIGAFPVFLPPLDLQNKFASFVDSADRLIEKNKKRSIDVEELLEIKLEEYFG